MGDLAVFDEIKPFTSKDFNLTYFKHGEDYLFKAIDIAKELGYRNTRKAVRDHVKDKYKVCLEADRSGSTGTNRSGGAPTIFFSLPGLFQFLATSNMSRAQPFQDWVFEKVLPSIMKTGEYKLTLKQKVDTVLKDVDSTNKAAARKMLVEASEKCKDLTKKERGRRGGLACQENIRMLKLYVSALEENVALKDELIENLKRENSTLREGNVRKDGFRQIALDLDYFKKV